MKRTIFVFIFVLIVTGVAQAPSFAITDSPEIVAETAILIDATTGKILYEKDIDVLKEPASTTKIMTCLLALEHLPLDKVITIDALSPHTGGSRIYIIEGEELTVEQLLYALMLDSANDAAVALAIAISGDASEFSSLMNDRARELGAKNPSFKNPHGLHQEGHLASAYDLAMISQEAMKNPEFRKIVSTYKYTIPSTNKQPEERYLYNTNRLIYDEVTKVPVKGVMTPAKYEGATGVKTGFTPQAGGTLVASAKRDGTELITVVLASMDAARFGDSISLLDFGFENYYTHKAIDSSAQIDDVKVKGGSVKSVAVKIQEDRYITLPKEASLSLISTEVVMDSNVAAPVEAGQVLGRVEIYEGSDLIDEALVVATSDVPEGGFLSRFGIEDSVSEAILKYIIIFACALGFLILVYIILSVSYERRRKARRRARAMQIALERERKQKEMEQRRWPY